MPRRPWLPAAFLVLVLVVAGCERSGSGPEPPVTNPPTSGATCDDPTGDQSLLAGELGGNLREPAGVDLTHAEARVTDTSLRVSFTTAGPIGVAPLPEFRLAHGLTGQVDSFELLATPPESGTGPWELRLATFRPDGRGGVGEVRTLLPVAVKVEGNTLSYEVPRQSLPSLTSYVWQFGSSATANDTIIDVCDTYGAGTAGTTTSAPSAPLSSTPALPLGATQAYRTGSEVTVHAAEAVPGPAGTTDVAVDLRVCAPPGARIESARADLAVSATDQRAYRAAGAAPPRLPEYPASIVLDPGACRRAWVTVPLPERATPAAVVYRPDPRGTGALRWLLP